MFSHKYDIHSYKQIPEKFLDYCSFYEETEDITILNYRYDSWQGATIAIPIDDYKIDETVEDNIYIISSGTEIIDYWANTYDETQYVSKNSPQNILKHIYPNANIELYIYSSSSYSIFSDIVNYINSKESGKIIFSFSDFNPLYASSDYADIKAFLDTINDAAFSHGLDLYTVYTPTSNYTDELYNSIESYVYQKKPRKVLNFYAVLERTRDDLPDALLDENYYLISTDFRALYGEPFYQGDRFDGYNVYSRNIINLYSRFILSNVFNLDREEYYVSFMYASNVKSKYSTWINRQDEYMAEDFHIDQYKHGGWSLQGRYGQTIFKNTGDIVSVGVHTSYDQYLWMCEQGGMTCKKEADEQINDIDLLNFYVFFKGIPYKEVKPPVFPTTGCPWFTISDKNKSDYGIDNHGCKLYITKVDSSFVLTIRLMHVSAQRPDVWQSITFGEFIGRQDGYNIDQFYCAGGNQALSPDSWTYYMQSHIIGLQMDVDVKNSAIINSNILHPSKFEKANMSNFRIMNAEGTWEDIYSATQGYEDYQYLDGVGRAAIYTWGAPLTKPNFSLSTSLNTAYPYLDWQHKIDSYTINNYDLKKNNMSGKVDPLTVYLAK